MDSVALTKGLTLETSAFQSLYGGQITLSTPLINQIFVFHSPTDAASQFLQKLTPFTDRLNRLLAAFQQYLHFAGREKKREHGKNVRKMGIKFTLRARDSVVLLSLL